MDSIVVSSTVDGDLVLHRAVLVCVHRHEPRTMSDVIRRRAEVPVKHDVVGCPTRHAADEVIGPLVPSAAGRFE